MEDLVQREHEIMKVCLLAGQIMLQSGAETYRVEDTMVRIAASFGVDKTHSYMTPTGLIFSMEDPQPITRLNRISDRTTNLHKIDRRELENIQRTGDIYPLWLRLLMAALASGCFLIMFRGIWPDFLPAAVAGGLGYYCTLMLQRMIPVKFFAEFSGALAIGLCSILFVRFGFGRDLDIIVISSVMPLVPGLLITNAIRDLMAGHLVSGLSKGAEAFITSFAIGAGIAFMLSFQ